MRNCQTVVVFPQGNLGISRTNQCLENPPQLSLLYTKRNFRHYDRTQCYGKDPLNSRNVCQQASNQLRLVPVSNLSDRWAADPPFQTNGVGPPPRETSLTSLAPHPSPGAYLQRNKSHGLIKWSFHQFCLGPTSLSEDDECLWLKRRVKRIWRTLQRASTLSLKMSGNHRNSERFTSLGHL